MKQPRVIDFDPNANVPKLASPMDGLPTIERPKKPGPAAAIRAELEQARDGTHPNELKQSPFFAPPRSPVKPKALPKPEPSPSTGLDLLVNAENDVSLRLSEREIDALEDLKTDLRKQYRLTVPKNDIL